jgi:hypothetical protein
MILGVRGDALTAVWLTIRDWNAPALASGALLRLYPPPRLMVLHPLSSRVLDQTGGCSSKI